jgi:succinate dehydrogenase flavin-adding protein (antitoxin of CptAB toxin-antitoxin module)
MDVFLIKTFLDKGFVGVRISNVNIFLKLVEVQDRDTYFSSYL